MLLFPFRKIPGSDLDSPCWCVLSGHRGHQGIDLGTVYDNSNLQPAQSNARLLCSICWGKHIYVFMHGIQCYSLFSVWRRGNFVQYCLLKKHYLVLLSPYFLDVNNKKIICVHLWMKKKIRKPECSMLNIMQTHCCYENIDIENLSSIFIVRFFFIIW